MTHDELHAKAIMAVDVAADEGALETGRFGTVDEYSAVRSWVDRAADALHERDAPTCVEHGRHEELHRLARGAIRDVDFDEDIATRSEVLAWVNAAAEALRIQRDGPRPGIATVETGPLCDFACSHGAWCTLPRHHEQDAHRIDACGCGATPKHRGEGTHGLRIAADAVHRWLLHRPAK